MNRAGYEYSIWHLVNGVLVELEAPAPATPPGELAYDVARAELQHVLAHGALRAALGAGKQGAQPS